MADRLIAVVHGEPTINWFTEEAPVVPQILTEADPWGQMNSRWHALQGGVFLLRTLIEKTRVRPFEIMGPTWPNKPNINDLLYHQTYATVKEVRGTWVVNRVSGRRNGLRAPLGSMQLGDVSPVDVKLLVLDDAGMGFREHPSLWPLDKELLEDTWVLLKMGGPVAQGKLWKRLYRTVSERLVVVADIKDLRRGEIEVSKDISWERTARDLAAQLIHQPSINALSRCAYAVVHLGTVGALVMQRSHGSNKLPKTTLLFRPEKMEGHQDSRVWGHTTVLTAAIARELMRALKAGSGVEDVEILDAVERGLKAMKVVDELGYAVVPGSSMAFPLGAIKAALAADGANTADTSPTSASADSRSSSTDSEYFASADVPLPTLLRQEYFAGRELPDQPGLWTILRQKHGPETLNALAETIAQYGVAKALKDVPRGSFGRLTTVDRQEIEDFRSIARLVQEYCQDDLQRPLSIAVFGAPGAGKSFAVVEILESLRESAAHIGDIKTLNFNLSQFVKTSELIDAFHLVRDLGLAGKMPVIFWDEFDTSFENQQFGWLRYFLSPMQDGVFRERDAIHPIGRCIFAFAGGRTSRFSEFRSLALENEEMFRSVKGPDFLSRIRGYLDIQGPNREARIDGNVAVEDPYFLVRRAITLRSLLWGSRRSVFRLPPDKEARDTGQKLHIDKGVLHAFLHIGRYEHGVRSMSAIIEMSSMHGKETYDRSCLPATSQLGLHVDPREFLALVRSLDLPEFVNGSFLAIARNIYKSIRNETAQWRFEDLEEQYKDAPIDDYKYPANVTSFESLSPMARRQYEEFVYGIPNMLGDKGYRIVRAVGGDSATELPVEIVKSLARREHRRWMNSMAISGHDKTSNPFMVPWDQLPHRQRTLELLRIGAIPNALMASKYIVQKYVGDLGL